MSKEFGAVLACIGGAAAEILLFCGVAAGLDYLTELTAIARSGYQYLETPQKQIVLAVIPFLPSSAERYKMVQDLGNTIWGEKRPFSEGFTWYKYKKSTGQLGGDTKKEGAENSAPSEKVGLMSLVPQVSPGHPVPRPVVPQRQVRRQAQAFLQFAYPQPLQPVSSSGNPAD